MKTFEEAFQKVLARPFSLKMAESVASVAMMNESEKFLMFLRSSEHEQAYQAGLIATENLGDKEAGERMRQLCETTLVFVFECGMLTGMEMEKP